MQRIAIIGLAAVGKTTLAAALAERLRAPHVALDRLHWEPDWTPAAPEVFRARVTAAIASKTWTVDGNYALARELVWLRADTILWLDYGLATIYPQLLRRSLRRLWRQEELWNGNREQVADFFTRDSLFLYNWATNQRHRQLYPQLSAEQRTAHVIHLRSRRDTRTFLNACPRR